MLWSMLLPKLKMHFIFLIKLFKLLKYHKPIMTPTHRTDGEIQRKQPKKELLMGLGTLSSCIVVVQY
jgi:hypothetical protein